MSKLKHNQKIKDKIELLILDLKEILQNDERHMADVGIILEVKSADTLNIMRECFEIQYKK